MKKVLFCVLFLIFWYASCFSMVLLDIKVEEKIKDKPETFELIDQATVELYDSIQTSCFVGNFTLSAMPAVFDSANLTLSVELFTLGPNIQRFSKEYLLKSGEETVLTQLKAKDNIFFRVKITPRIVFEETNKCNSNTNDSSESWFSDPSTHFYYHYILETLPDYHWNMNKGILEEFYHGIWSKFGFWDPSKIDYILAPCELKEIYWDKRFGMGLNPTKREVYVIYNQKTRTVDGPGVGMFMFYKYWGYAPAMLVEGAAGYTTLCHYQAKKLKKQGKLFPLWQLEISKDYKSKPEEIAFYQVSSFVKYLVDTYGVGKFKKFYDETTDLTFEKTIFKVYNKKLFELEKEWLAYLDTFEESEANIAFFVQIKVGYRHYDEAVELLNDLVQTSSNKSGYLSDLAGVYYTIGDYPRAESLYQEILKLQPESPVFHYVLGNVYDLLGDYANAESLYVKAIDLDTAYALPFVKMGYLYLTKGDCKKAEEFYNQALSKDPGSDQAVDIFVGMAECDKALGNPEQAQEDLRRGFYQAQTLLNNLPEASIPYYRTGQVYLAMGFADTASYYLEIAAMLQDIPNKRGEILLDLAKAYKIIGESDLAKRACQEILEINCGAREKSQAQKLLTELADKKQERK